MNNLCILREFDSDHIADECVPILPLTCINSHEIKNPLVKNNSNMLYICTTERDLVTLRKPPKSQSLSISSTKLESKNKLVMRESTMKEEATKGSDIKEEELKLELKINRYQTKLTPELKDNFKRLIKFKPISLEEILKHKANLDPQPIKKKTLVLDIDGTLVCTSTREHPTNHIKGEGQKFKQIKSISVRPYAIELIRTLSVFFEIVIFTFGTSSYANIIANYLDPENKYIEYIFHRAHCIVDNDLVIKNLRVIGGRELKDLIILDNSVASFAANIENGIYIPTYEKDNTDIELKRVMEFLLGIVNVDDVRPYVREFAGICELLEVYKQSTN
jgi:Dullard-like phosphatase family protein